MLLLFVSFQSLGQNLRFTKNQLSNLLKSSINQSSKKSISVGSRAWIICNTDSAYYKADTIKLYDNINYFYQRNSCCSFIEWTFYKRNAFLQNKAQICREPSSMSALTEYCEFKIAKKKDNVYLIVIDKHLKKFELVSISQLKLTNNGVVNEITLKKVSY